MIIKSLLLATLLAFSAIVHSAGVNLPVDRDGIIMNFPSCSVGGTRVAYQKTTSAFLSTMGISLAMAKHNTATGKPTIYFDVAEFATYSPEFQVWVFAHECSHWELGHVFRSYNKMNSRVDYEENDADCSAAKKLVQMGFDDRQLSIVYNDIEQAQVRMIESLPPARPGMVSKPPEPMIRVNHARTCVNEAKNILRR
jgi:hypothetical protein